MPYSYNGWYASPNLRIRPLVVAGESFVPGVLDDPDVYEVLRYLAQQLHERVEPIVAAGWHQMDDWGYNYRPTTNDNSLSCHASGTAFDYNATRHPYGVRASANFSARQIATIHEIISDLPIVWGGDYRNSVDAMHFEIMGSKAAVAAAAARIRRNNTPRDWVDMASRDELREVVDNALDAKFNDALIERIATKAATKVWNRQFEVPGVSGKVKRKASDLFKAVVAKTVGKMP